MRQQRVRQLHYLRAAGACGGHDQVLARCRVVYYTHRMQVKLVFAARRKKRGIMYRAGHTRLWGVCVLFLGETSAAVFLQAAFV